MTGQEADFDEGLDFDCFLVTGFLEEVAFNIARSASSNFIGLRDIGLDRAIWKHRRWDVFFHKGVNLQKGYSSLTDTKEDS